MDRDQVGQEIPETMMKMMGTLEDHHHLGLLVPAGSPGRTILETDTTLLPDDHMEDHQEMVQTDLEEEVTTIPTETVEVETMEALASVHIDGMDRQRMSASRGRETP